MMKIDASEVFPTEIFDNILRYTSEDVDTSCSKKMQGRTLHSWKQELQIINQFMTRVITRLDIGKYSTQRRDLSALQSAVIGCDKKLLTSSDGVITYIYRIRHSIQGILKTIDSKDISKLEKAHQEEQNAVVLAGQHDRIFPRCFENFFLAVHIQHKVFENRSITDPVQKSISFNMLLSTTIIPNEKIPWHEVEDFLKGAHRIACAIPNRSDRNRCLQDLASIIIEKTEAYSLAVDVIEKIEVSDLATIRYILKLGQRMYQDLLKTRQQDQLSVILPKMKAYFVQCCRLVDAAIKLLDAIAKINQDLDD